MVSRAREAGEPSVRVDVLYAETLYRLHEYSQAIQILEGRSEEAANDPDYLNLLGMSHAGLGEYEAAGRVLDKALKQDPQRPDLLVQSWNDLSEGRSK